jgi:hypothetical protein
VGLRFARTPSWTGLPRDIFNTCGRPVGQVVAGREERRLTLLDLGLRREEGEAGGSCGNGGEQGEERDSPLINGRGSGVDSIRDRRPEPIQIQMRVLRIAGRKKGELMGARLRTGRNGRSGARV